jgi:hypothetical protein
MLNIEDVEEILNKLGFIRQIDYFEDKLSFIKFWEIL